MRLKTSSARPTTRTPSSKTLLSCLTRSGRSNSSWARRLTLRTPRKASCISRRRCQWLLPTWQTRMMLPRMQGQPKRTGSVCRVTRSSKTTMERLASTSYGMDWEPRSLQPRPVETARIRGQKSSNLLRNDKFYIFIFSYFPIIF